MEMQPGAFVSKASTDDWQTDPDGPGSQRTSWCMPTA